MKVEKPLVCDKDHLTEGEVYLLNNEPYFVTCAVGIVNLINGKYTAYGAIGGHCKFHHQPQAKLVL